MCAYFSGDGCSDASDEVGVPGGGESNGLWEGGCFTEPRHTVEGFCSGGEGGETCVVDGRLCLVEQRDFLGDGELVDNGGGVVVGTVMSGLWRL